MKKITLFTLRAFVLLFSCIHFLNSNAQTVTTFAGSTGGFADGTGTAALFNSPYGVAIATDGTIFVTDTFNNSIRKITTDGVVTTLVDNTTGTAIKLGQPTGVAIAKDGTIYVTQDYRISKISKDGVKTSLAGGFIGNSDGVGIAAQFNFAKGLAIAVDGTVFVADFYNNRIRKITADGVVTTLSGSNQGFADGAGAAAQFYNPAGVAVANDGTVFVADTFNHRIRKITPDGVVTTLAGSTKGFADGIGTVAKFEKPSGIAVADDGTIFVADTFNHRIRKITSAGVVTTLAGSGYQGTDDGASNLARFYRPYALAVDEAGTVLVADTNNNRIRKIAPLLATTNFQLENKISIYPNPTSSLVNLELDAVIAINITIFDMNGRALQSKNILDNKIPIDISNLANGIYLMQINTNKGKISKKIVKQ